MRDPSWPLRLAEYIESRREVPFQWGVHDCCQFAAGAVQAMTGDALIVDFRYADERQALRMIRKAGSLDALAHRVLGEPLPSVAQARRGDVVMADLDRGPTVGICLGATSAYASAVGFVLVPTHFARVAWSID